MGMGDDPKLVFGVTVLIIGVVFIGCTFFNLDRIDRYFSYGPVRTTCDHDHEQLDHPYSEDTHSVLLVS